MPFLDIDEDHTDWHYGFEATPLFDIQHAYPPFDGTIGVQLTQTLDQTASYIKEGDSIFRTEKQQVVYRWCKRRLRAKHDRESVYVSSGLSEGAERAPNAESIRKSETLNHLVVRQLWVWKLDGNTILISIPSRNYPGPANDLLETIRQGNLGTVQSSNDLIKNILQETVSFPEKFQRAGLGEHVLDIFKAEISAEAIKEVGFFQNFSDPTWSPEGIDRTIQQASESILLVKDAHDELRLLRQLFEQQLRVVEEFSLAFWSPELSNETQKPGLSDETLESLRDNFIHDCGLQSLMQRVDQLDQDAAATPEGLTNIIQAMQAQASLKEAEATRNMNLIILPFTIVTVIFTPLSFMTSLFAVNNDGFPHNDDEELRIPSSWFTIRMGDHRTKDLKVTKTSLDK
ncbi:hypothetical protein FSARC_1711 [Fusarium sarcochroum]|uniref:Uncharacterized protein n=1 Tax=Fusarium sarcochroum TaxID=1208366 RepID=A0A8H4U8L3_9HYPO|nr:hypothetical protein FSARC_1711 [Fusarium sarcochroum]